jgi:hypothetical protein
VRPRVMQLYGGDRFAGRLLVAADGPAEFLHERDGLILGVVDPEGEHKHSPVNARANVTILNITSPD